MDGRQDLYVRMVMKEGVSATRFQARDIILTNITVLNEREFRGIVNESKNEHERGALDNPKEPANGDEMFTRLSAFDNDRRIDKVNKCLRPGSFSTTQEDYLKCKKDNDDPVERYALPNDDEIKFAFEIKPKKAD